MAFNIKDAITAALQHLNNAEQALHMAASSTQGLARSLRKAKQSLKEVWEEVWEDTQVSLQIQALNTPPLHCLVLEPERSMPASVPSDSKP